MQMATFICSPENRYWGFLGSSVGKESACNAGDPGSGRFPGEGIGYPPQYSCLENSHGQRGSGGLRGVEESDTTE